MAKIFLIRHGETDVNKSGLTHKTNDDTGLTETGKEQIGLVAETLKQNLVSKIVSSDENRAVLSSEIVANELGLKLQVSANLKERNWGDLEGKPWSEIKLILDNLSLEERYNYLPPNGESWKQFEERIYGEIDSLVNKYPEENIAVFTHGGVIRALITRLLNEPKQESFKYDPPNASITIFSYEDGVYSIERLMFTDHLNSLNNYSRS